jgi:hypothetical protein
MRRLLLITFLFISIHTSAQQLSLNESSKLFEYSHVKEGDKTVDQQRARLEELGYKNITADPNKVSSEGFTSHLVGGFATVEIRYNTRYEFKEGRYKLTLTNFVLTDKNGSQALENLGSYQKRWIKTLNKKLPGIVAQLENGVSDNNW